MRLIADDRAADAGRLAPETIKGGPLDIGRMRRSPVPASVLEMVREFLAYYRHAHGAGMSPAAVAASAAKRALGARRGAPPR